MEKAKSPRPATGVGAGDKNQTVARVDAQGVNTCLGLQNPRMIGQQGQWKYSVRSAKSADCARMSGVKQQRTVLNC
ncbi:MAG: hypothetical protein JNM22_13995 [Saprospiraceae bacterium]|nr:hypothetical protein [Saprospiraceae bacterium]